MKYHGVNTHVKFLASIALFISGVGAQLPTNTLYGSEASEGFVSLFDGTRANFVTNWVDYQKGNPNTSTLNSSWTYDDPTKSMLCGGCQINVRSKAIFKDFDFRFQYKCSGNQGVFYRSLIDYVTNYDSGVEFAVDDNTSQDPSHGGGALDTRAGAAYGLYPTEDLSSYHHFGDIDPWNECRIIVIGDSVQHWMNGKLIVKYRYFSDDFFAHYSHWAAGKTMGFAIQGDVSAGPILSGYLGWQGDHGGALYVRNLRVNTKPSWTAKYQWPLGPTAIVNGKQESILKPKIISYAGKLSVEIKSEKIVTAALFSLSGKKLLQGKVTNKSVIEFSSQPKRGIYLLEYTNNNGVSKMGKINVVNLVIP